MRLSYPHRVVKIRVQYLADAMDVIADLMNEVGQSEHYSGPYTGRGYRKLERLWDRLSDAAEDPKNEVSQDEALEFRQRKAARHWRRIKAERDANAQGKSLLDYRESKELANNTESAETQKATGQMATVTPVLKPSATPTPSPTPKAPARWGS